MSTVADWTLLTNHGAVLLYVALHPEATIRQVSEGVDITERATARILAQLRADGYVVATRRGRRNSYTIAADLPMRHAVARGFSVRQLLDGLLTGMTQSINHRGRRLPFTVEHHPRTGD